MIGEIISGVIRFVVFAIVFVILMNLLTDLSDGIIFMGAMLYAAIMDVKYSVDHPTVDTQEDV